ncbi:hypothetical protein N2152v2_001111 [Parachlorella kessleri]
MHAALVAIAFVLLAAANPAAASPDDGSSQGQNHVWYIAAEETLWDYAPGGKNLCFRHQKGHSHDEEEHQDTDDTEDLLWVNKGLGRFLKKAVYVQYTNDSFQEVIPKPQEFNHTGLLGPILRARVGDTITVIFRNKLPFPVNLEPTGLQPNIAPEANGAAAFAPAAAPNETLTYTWLVPEDAGPSDGDPNYKLWLYSSGVDPVAHDVAGLVGGFLIGRNASAQAAAEAASTLAPEADYDVIMLLMIMDENKSPFYSDNLAGRSADDLNGIDSEEDLEESLLKHSVNGYLFCSGPMAEMQQGDRVRWHVATLGTETDLHNAHVHGNTFSQRGLRDDQLKLIAGSVQSVVMDADNAAIWWMHCHVNDHITAGMMALYHVLPNNATNAIEDGVKAELNGTTRNYYIAAEEASMRGLPVETVMWNYAPENGYMCDGAWQPWTEEQAEYVANRTGFIGSTYIKGQFIEYTDATFTQKKERAPEDDYLGILGPMLRAEVGDTIEVLLINRMRYPVSMHPHGVRYMKDSEGAPYNDGTSGKDIMDDVVQPGTNYTYVWQASGGDKGGECAVPETAAPGPAGGSTRLWMYHSHTNEITDTYAGLAGGIIVGRRGVLDRDTLAATDVDREVMLFFSVMNEANSLFFEDNVDHFVKGHEAKDEQEDHEEYEEEFEESNLMHSINGYVYCNMPPLQFTVGERVRVYVMALGTEVDMHTPNMQHSVFRTPLGGHTMPALSMVPGSMHTVDLIPETPGEALVQCRVGDHIAAGMRALYSVVPGPDTATMQEASGTEPAQRYYIAAEPVEWEYAPLGLDACNGEPFGEEALVFVGQVNGSTIGSRYLKALYRQYTDETFTELAPRPVEAGILGPTLLLEAGQQFEVVFQNRLDFDVNIAFDGALEARHDTKAGTKVAPGANFTYSYVIPDSMAPGSQDLSTVAYAYTSSVDLITHPNAGLIGMLVVATPGSLTPANTTTASSWQQLPQGVDRLIPLLFNIQNENENPFLGLNMAATGVQADVVGSDDFEESNLMHSVNGYVYCNIPALEVALNSTVRFVMLGMGSEADMHSPTFTGQVLLSVGSTSRTVELMPTVTKVVDMVPSEAGRWQFYCDVHDHIVAGMRGTLVVA